MTSRAESEINFVFVFLDLCTLPDAFIIIIIHYCPIRSLVLRSFMHFICIVSADFYGRPFPPRNKRIMKKVIAAFYLTIRSQNRDFNCEFLSCNSAFILTIAHFLSHNFFFFFIASLFHNNSDFTKFQV